MPNFFRAFSFLFLFFWGLCLSIFFLFSNGFALLCPLCLFSFVYLPFLALLCRATDEHCLLSLPHFLLVCVCVRWPVKTLHFQKHNHRHLDPVFPWGVEVLPFPSPLSAISLPTHWRQCSNTMVCNSCPLHWPTVFSCTAMRLSKWWRHHGGYNQLVQRSQHTSTHHPACCRLQS